MTQHSNRALSLCEAARSTYAVRLVLGAAGEPHVLFVHTVPLVALTFSSKHYNDSYLLDPVRTPHINTAGLQISLVVS
jgi:hypothetical protein